jgi:phosphate transport system substrate-binding protein
VAEKLDDLVPRVILSIDGPGTGDGFELFCDGETDISGASRAIKDGEIEACEANGIEWIELKVAIDGLAVVTNPANDSVDCLNYADLYALVGPESQGVDRWQDATALARELGSDTELPRLALTITAPGEESGTYDSFVELVLDDLAEERGQHPETRPDYQASGDDNVIVQGVEGATGSLGWVGFAFAEEAGDAVKELAIAEEPGGPCVEPTGETIADGSYPISRPLFIYVNAARAEASPALRAYVDHFLSDEGIVSVEEVGYVSLPPPELAATRAIWRSRTTGHAAPPAADLEAAARGEVTSS